LELTNYSRIAIVGGGPSGSLTACFMLDIAEHLGIRLNVDIYEPAAFSAPGAKGCNYCGGIVSETLVQMLAMEGINLPPELVQRGIDSYRLHTEQGAASISTPLAEMRIAALFRGSGPLDCVKRATEIPLQERVSYRSFDGFLLDLAIEKGANLIPRHVAEVNRDQELPTVTEKGGEPRQYDLVVGAVGVNGGGLKIFEKAGLNLRPPKTTRAYITEIYLGKEEVDRHFGNTMHVFLVKIPRVSFAAIVPKGEYVTVTMLGKNLDNRSAEMFLNHPKVQASFPAETDLSPNSCKCLPFVNIGMASPVFDDRLVLVGDSGASRLYKDGLGAAYRTAKACATTALVHGISRRDFRRYYLPTCRKLHYDNLIGKSVFLSVNLIKGLPPLSRGMLRMVRREQNPSTGSKAMSMVLWDTFTGSNSYRSIFMRCMHPAFLLRLFRESIHSLLGGSKGTRP
jgi:flavin-dependent dehydrogenase